MPRVILDGAHAEELLSDMEAAAREFIDRFDRASGLWDLVPARGWTPGQHADHLANTHMIFADRFEHAVLDLENDQLAPLPRRGLLQSFVVRMLTQSRKFPRGGRAIAAAQAGPSPDRSATLARLRGEVARYRALVERLPQADLDQVWIKNPMVPLRWHYTLPEVLRVHACHTRHHLLLVDEIARTK